MLLPIEFSAEIGQLLGPEEGESLLRTLTESQPPTSIRLNEARPEACPEWSSLPAVPWCRTGRYLPERPSFTFDPRLHAGAYYVQEASSMFVEQAVRQHLSDEPVVALDLCAAPGGKSTLLRSLLPEGSLLVANEIVRTRAQILAENLTKWGHPDVVVTQNAPADFTPLGALFDLILTDVPCSGEGMFRKDPASVEEWSTANVQQCSQRQRAILQDIWPCLKPGGLLIYSTCTYNLQEDEENVRWMAEELGADILPLEVADEWHITGNLLPEGADFPVFRFLPHRTQGEGFFLAVLRKPAAPSEGYRRPKSGKKAAPAKPLWSKAQEATLCSWLREPQHYRLLLMGSLITAVPAPYADLCRLLMERLHVLQAGVALAEPKGKDLVPCHALSLSTALRPDAFPRVELTYEQAISYLRREAIFVPSGGSKGYLLVAFYSLPLGFVKNLGSRANNLYPNEWRIRSVR